MNYPQLIISLVVLAVIFHVLLGGVAYGILLERKIAAWAQDRIGPNRVGFGGLIRPLINLLLWIPLAPLKLVGLCRDVDPDKLWQTPAGQALYEFHFWGLGQAIADGVKFVGKEDYNPGNVDKTLFILAPILAVLPAAIAWAVIPWGGAWTFPAMDLGFIGLDIAWDATVVHWAVADVNIGVIYILAIGSLAVYGITVGAWAANNKYTFLGGIRATAQMLSYEIPMGLCVLAVLLLAGTANPGDIIATQADYYYGIPQWLVFQQPLACILFFICILAESNRAPFDLAECEQELIGGFHTEYSSMKFALFFLGEYMHMMTGCAFLALLFLGGWHMPYLDLVMYGIDTPQPVVGFHDGGLMSILHGFGLPIWLLSLLGVILKIKVFLFKVLLLLILMMWVRWTLPRFRFDQLMQLAWRNMIPLTLVILLTTGTFVYLGLQSYMWAANLGILALALTVGPMLPSGPPVNRRVPLPGSRFSPLPTD